MAPRDKRKEVPPQIVPETGISGDYFNEYCVLFYWFERESPQGFLDLLSKKVESKPFQRYEERYGPESYDFDLSNPQIDLLNQTADYINSRVKQGNLELTDFFRLVFCATDLIYGEEESPRRLASYTERIGV